MNVFNTQANIFKVNGGLADIFANRPAANGSYYIFWSTDTGEIFYDNGTWIQFGGGGGGGFFFYLNSVADLINLQNTSALIAGANYAINLPFFNQDLGQTIIVKAIDARIIDTSASLLTYAPKSIFYNPGNWFGNNYLGVWNEFVTPNIGDRVIWGAKIWQNTTGITGTFVDEFNLDSNYSVIPYGSNNYDFLALNVITNNIVSLIYKANYRNITVNYQAPFFQYVIINDWNDENITNVNCSNVLNNNSFIDRCNATRFIQYNRGTTVNKSNILNNNCGNIINNKVNDIIENIVVDTIQDNTTPTISYNTCGDIINNFVANYISYNNACNRIDLNNVIQIGYNNTTGAIFNNNFTGNIEFNTNNGNINNNSGAILGIVLNNNNGSINDNSIRFVITKNSNGGDIINNQSNVTLIEHNSNTGNINNNNNTGAIQHNNNNGNISNNTCLAITNNYCGGNLSNNSNIGNISSNNNGGPITGNSNAGQIFQNMNTASIQNNSNNGQIYRNMNNGQILGITAPTAQIFSNVNNGDILVSTPGNITDPIINK